MNTRPYFHLFRLREARYTTSKHTTHHPKTHKTSANITGKGSSNLKTHNTSANILGGGSGNVKTHKTSANIITGVGGVLANLRGEGGSSLVARRSPLVSRRSSLVAVALGLLLSWELDVTSAVQKKCKGTPCWLQIFCTEQGVIECNSYL